jgi:hypothetical protein
MTSPGASCQGILSENIKAQSKKRENDLGINQ